MNVPLARTLLRPLAVVRIVAAARFSLAVLALVWGSLMGVAWFVRSVLTQSHEDKVNISGTYTNQRIIISLYVRTKEHSGVTTA